MLFWWVINSDSLLNYGSFFESNGKRRRKGGVRDHGEKIAKPDLGSNTVSSISITNTNTLQIKKYKYNNFSQYLKYKIQQTFYFKIHLQIP